MRFAAPVAAAGTPVTRLNPVTKLAAVLVLSLAVLATVDPVTPAVAIAGTLAVLPFAGLRPGPLLRRLWPLLLGAATVGVVNVLFAGEATGTLYVHSGPFRLSSGSLAAGAALALRVLAIALPGLVAFATTDPTDLADCLVRQVRVPARFALGALAAYRLMPLLADEWELLGLARRARGVDAGRSPVARGRLFATTLFALLVGAVRRGGRLATAMDARGFDASTPRTYARTHPVRRVDLLVFAGGVALAALSLGVSVAVGAFRPLVGG
ncbi:energy-coupling factor transporter transmembrane component T family protein [Actinocatenispora rupis]|uniref:ABC transporter n=1 Tax=Actinocatenispora rupis TaxID=519421 RepID=A0A8J3JE43_9ACTN|nr:energy-coupling factor transporter transmembrane component T [Actinocatenispora rupis]GID14802.1 ABC transporter [Actinocatenispora rupis]